MNMSQAGQVEHQWKRLRKSVLFAEVVALTHHIDEADHIGVVTITPFGTPVLPEVKSRFAIVSGAMLAGAQACAGSRSRAPNTRNRGHRAVRATTSDCSA
jgi:hypothetical protein